MIKIILWFLALLFIGFLMMVITLWVIRRYERILAEVKSIDLICPKEKCKYYKEISMECDCCRRYYSDRFEKYLEEEEDK